jgi:PKD repeat protein
VVNKYEIVSFFPIISPDLLVSSILWEFGDGETSTDMLPTHGYRFAGVYHVTLTVYLYDLTNIVEKKYYYITVNDIDNTIPDFSDRASNLLIEQVRKQYGKPRTTPFTAEEMLPAIPTPAVVEVEPITDMADRAANLLNENVRRIYGAG